jgi:hypothetical protein
MQKITVIPDGPLGPIRDPTLNATCAASWVPALAALGWDDNVAMLSIIHHGRTISLPIASRCVRAFSAAGISASG